jgi:hypothetical protein
MSIDWFFSLSILEKWTVGAAAGRRGAAHGRFFVFLIRVNPR